LEKIERITIEVEYVETGKKPEREFASGVSNFTVPPGYPNDSFMAGLTSGETITVDHTGGGGTKNSNSIRVFGDLIVNAGEGGMSNMDVMAGVRI